jgi:hypothetical protein
MERPQVGWCSGKLPAIDSKVHVLHKLQEWSKKVLWQRFWLDLCTKQVVSARAYAYQVLPYSSSRIRLIDMRTLQADSCLNFEQIDPLYISVGGQEGGFGGGGSFWVGGPKFTHDCQKKKMYASWVVA